MVWVANREKPISDRFSSQLKILDGNLVLLNESKIQIWSTNVNPAGSNSTHAVLLDNGNFVLRDGPKSSDPIWQSFDHPTDTWLPGGKLGIDKRTNTTQLLTSWKNPDDPSPGLFSLGIDPAGTSQYFLKWNSFEQYWTSGLWNGHAFAAVPEMRADIIKRTNYIHIFWFVNNVNESYFTYNYKNNSTMSRFVLDFSGLLTQILWVESSKNWNIFWTVPRQLCQVYGYCGAFGVCNQNPVPVCSCLKGFVPRSDKEWKLSDYTGGCVRKTQLECPGNSSTYAVKDRFFVHPSMALPKYAHSLIAENAIGCANLCLSNCSCTAYAFDNTDCSMWTGDLVNVKQLLPGESNGKSLYLRLAASEFAERKDNKKFVIGIVAGSTVGIAVVLLIVWIVIMRQRKSNGEGKAVGDALVPFGYRDLQNATKNFSEKLGGGAFGSVFKGSLPGPTTIAVKKLDSISQGEKQFRMEVSTIGTIQHLNVVRLRGFCSEGKKKLLVYDYMPNGSLNSHLFSRENHSKYLDWTKRFQIALGTARGLMYLHEKCRDCIIHCDIKPENILLDSEFCPKVADFGLAKLMGREFSRVLTTMRGTRGYLAPEWISGVAITTKADVYSYGMMLFEFVSGRRNWDDCQDDEVEFFPFRIASKTAGGEDLLDLIDDRLEGTVNVEELNRVCRVACWCIQDDEAHRPSMGQIVQILEGSLDVNLPPIPKSLELDVDNQEDIAFFSELSSSQRLGPPSNILIASS